MIYTAKQYERKIRSFISTMPKSAKTALWKGGEVIRKHSIEKHLSGPTSTATGKNAMNASLSRQSGDLATTAYTKIESSSKSPAVRVVWPMKYAAAHEDPKAGSRVPARPFAKPSLMAKRQDALELILSEVMKAYVDS